MYPHHGNIINYCVQDVLCSGKTSGHNMVSEVGFTGVVRTAGYDCLRIGMNQSIAQ